METKVQNESVRESERLLQEQPQPRTRKSTDHFLQQASDPLTREPNRWKLGLSSRRSSIAGKTKTTSCTSCQYTAQLEPNKHDGTVGQLCTHNYTGESRNHIL